jgi:phosphopantothenate synthetase
MKPRVYLETTIASYLTARSSSDLLLAAHQQLTMEWWTQHRQRFEVFVSDLVLLEVSRGDRAAASKRLAELAGISVFVLRSN